MTREEAIYRLKNTAWLGTDKERAETEQAVDMAIEALQAKTGEWIPCSKRLPNKEGLYMVTQKTYGDDYRFIDLFRYGKPTMPNRNVKGACWYRSDSEWGDVVYDDTDILAWRPLPKPYKGGDTE
jgi:hypothetical protein